MRKEYRFSRIEAKDLEAALHPNFDEKALKNRESFLSGLAASPGAATGAAYTAEAATAAKAREKDNICVRRNFTRRYQRGFAVSESGEYQSRRNDLSCGGCCSRYGNLFGNQDVND